MDKELQDALEKALPQVPEKLRKDFKIFATKGEFSSKEFENYFENDPNAVRIFEELFRAQKTAKEIISAVLSNDSSERGKETL